MDTSAASPEADAASFGTVAALGIAQIISWGSLYYAFSFLITPLMEASGGDKPTVFAAFSLGLFVSGLLSAPIGALIDRRGGRGVMTAGSLAGAVLLRIAVAGAVGRSRCTRSGQASAR